MAKKSFRKSAQKSMGGINAVIKNSLAAEPTIEEERIAALPQVNEPLTGGGPPSKKRAVRKSPPKPVSGSEKGCKPGDTRKTFILKKELAEKMMDVAYWEPGKLKDHVNAALEAYVAKHWTKKRPEGS